MIIVVNSEVSSSPEMRGAVAADDDDVVDDDDRRRRSNSHAGRIIKFPGDNRIENTSSIILRNEVILLR
jgi:hypothetical protein